MKDKEVVVTGGLGFIGSHLTERLVEDNQVTVIDDGSTGKLDNIKHLNLENIELVMGSITDINLGEIFEGKDYVFHQAAMASVPQSIEDPLGSNQVNITGTLRVLMAAKDNGVKKVVTASSSAVYGDSTHMPHSEDAPLKPMSPYAVTKAAGELYCNVLSSIYGLPTVSLRYFNVFGPRQDPQSQYAAVIPHFIDAILNGEKPVIYGDGEQSRDFIYVKRVVDANILACESKETGVFNIALGKGTTINQLVEIISQVFGKDVKPIYAEERTGDIKHSMADVSRAVSFGFNPKGDFKEGLRETVEWFKDIKSH